MAGGGAVALPALPPGLGVSTASWNSSFVIAGDLAAGDFTAGSAGLVVYDRIGLR